MFDKERVDKPIQRSNLRRILGKEYFVLKRKLKWYFGKINFAKVNPEINYENSFIKHRSFLLRPLKDVEMYLQHNKVTNLKIAISKIDKVVIKPGETFSIWKLVGRPTKHKGYLEGLVLRNGKTEKGIGGGLCQLDNLLYWMLLGK
jgi:vancomycin resistance protein VanW